MALVKSGSLGAGSPKMDYEIHATETAKSGTKRTVKVTLKAKCGGGNSLNFYGFPATWKATVNGTSSSSMTLKSSTKWYGNEAFRSFSTTLTVDVGTHASKAITVGVTVASSSGGEWNGSASGSFTVGATNTAPSWGSTRYVTIRENNASGAILSNTASGTENARKFPENVGSLYVTWTKATDPQGNTITYELYEQVSNGSWTKIYTGTNNYYTRSIGSGSSTQGKMYDYYVKAKDSGGLYASGNCDGTQVQKNTFTTATPTTSSLISASSANFTISWSGAKNTNGNGTFTYNISSPNITVYNQKVTGSSVAITIYKSGTVPSGCYVKFDDIKAFLAKTNYAGTISFSLKTTNAYGTSGTKTVGVKANIQVAPSEFTFGSASGTSVVNGISYLIPSEKQTVLTWGVSKDTYGGAISYDVYYSYNGGSYTLWQSNVATNTLTKSLPAINAKTTCKFKITAKTTYGKTVSAESGNFDLHYVGLPKVKYSLQRNQTGYTVDGLVTINTSIPNIKLNSIRYVIGSVSTPVTIANPFTVERNLSEELTEKITFYVLDKANADLKKAEVSTVLNVGKYNPMFSIREKGVGVNCVNAGAEGAMFKINGNTFIKGQTDLEGHFIVKNSSSAKTGKLWCGTGGIALHGEIGSNLYLGANNSQNDLIIDSDKISANKPLYLKTEINTNNGNGTVLYNNNWKIKEGVTVFSNLYIQPVGECRITSNTDISVYRPIRALSFNTSTGTILDNNLKLEGNVFVGNNGMIQAETGYVVVRSKASQTVYLQGAEVRATQPSTASSYVPVRASSFPVGSSLCYKQNIEPLTYEKAKYIFDNTDVYNYHLNSNVELGIYDKPKIGMISEMSPQEIRDEDGIDTYSVVATLWRIVKEQEKTINQLQNDNQMFKDTLNVMLEQPTN